MPRYLIVSLLGTVILLMETCGQVRFRSVKVTCVDFFSLILKPHLWNHFSVLFCIVCYDCTPISSSATVLPTNSISVMR